jgi:hypothetical protein
MHLVVSGEGKTDIGMFAYEDGAFVPGSMYYIVDKIIEKKYEFSYYDDCHELITFIPKSDLIEVCKSMKSFAGKKTPKETSYFFKNAKGLSQIAKAKCVEKKDDDVIAILFRDSDGTSSGPRDLWEQKVGSIEKAFEQENIKGVAMVPNPKSEAWLICALKENPFRYCDVLEERSGNDDSPDALKKEFSKLLSKRQIDYDTLNAKIKNNEIDVHAIDMPSYNYFLEHLEALL